MARPPLATERLSQLADGRLVYRLKRRWRDGTTAVLFEPQELIERLAPLVPPPRAHQVRYHGILGPCAGRRGQVVPATPPPPAQRADGTLATRGRPAAARGEPTGIHAKPRPDANADVPSPSDRRYSWAELLRRVFAVDVLKCDRCGGRLRIVAAIHPPETTQRILGHLGLPDASLPPVRPTRRKPCSPLVFPDVRCENTRNGSFAHPIVVDRMLLIGLKTQLVLPSRPSRSPRDGRSPRTVSSPRRAASSSVEHIPGCAAPSASTESATGSRSAKGAKKGRRRGGGGVPRRPSRLQVARSLPGFSCLPYQREATAMPTRARMGRPGNARSTVIPGRGLDGGRPARRKTPLAPGEEVPSDGAPKAAWSRVIESRPGPRGLFCSLPASPSEVEWHRSLRSSS